MSAKKTNSFCFLYVCSVVVVMVVVVEVVCVCGGGVYFFLACFRCWYQIWPISNFQKQNNVDYWVFLSLLFSLTLDSLNCPFQN